MTNNKPKDSNYEPRLNELISSKKAANLSGLSQAHIAHLIRKGLLWGQKLGRNWVTTEQAVVEYLAQNPKPGPKT